MKNLLMVALIAIISCTCLLAQSVDPSYPASVTSKATLEGGLLLSDGKYILYGDFLYLNGTRMPGVMKFNADGTIDNTFSIGTGPNGSVMAAAVQADGKILLAGRFTSFNGVNRSLLIRLNADGSVDNTFAPNIVIDQGGVEINLLVQTDGKILVTGPITSIEGSWYTGSLARFNTNGSKDATFSTTTSQVYDIALQSDGKIIIGGSFTKRIARLNSDGSNDDTFNPGGTGFNNTVLAVEVSSTGQIFAGGHFTSFNGTPNNYLACLDDTGAVDASWQGNGKADYIVQSFHMLSDGKLLVGGLMSRFGGTITKQPWRLNTNGSLDGSLAVGTGVNSGGIDNISANAGGEILIMGSFTLYNGQARDGIAVLESDGTLMPMSGQPNFQTPAWVNALKAHGADKFLIGHRGTELNGVPSIGLARLNLDGTTDATFNGNSKPNNYVDVITVDQNDRILIGGAFTSFDGTSTGRIARLSSAGDLDLNFTSNTGTGFSGPTVVIVEQPDGKILVGGRFESFNGTLRRCLARLNSDGTLDASFNSSNGLAANGVFSGVRDIAVLSDGKILVAGEFDSFDGNAVANLIRLNPDGSFDDTFRIGPGVYSGGGASYVDEILLLPNGKFLIGGGFDYVGGATLNAGDLALLNSDGTLQNGYRSSNFLGVEHMEMQTNGKILVLDKNTGIRRLNTDGTVDSPFRGISLNSFPQSVIVSGRTLIVGGWLSKAMGQMVAGLAKIDLPPDAPTNLTLTSSSPTSIALSWVDNASDEVDFAIERSLTNNSNYAEIAVLPANATQYTDATVVSGSTYFYRIKARSPLGWSASVEASLTAGQFNMGNKTITTCQGKLFDSGYGGNYSNNENYTLTIFPNTKGTSVQLVFSSFATDAADQLKIYDGMTVHADSLIGIYSGTTSPGTIRAIKGRGALTLVFQSNLSTVNTGWNAAISCGVFTAAPDNVQLDVPHRGEVRISWIDNAVNETGYVVERSITGVDSDFITLATLNADVSVYSDNEVNENTTYYYRVKATGQENDSEFTPVRGLAFGDGGIWRLKKDFGGIARTDAVGFAVDAKGYVGLGWAGGAQAMNLQSYDAVMDYWSVDVASFSGLVRSEAVAFVIGSKAYVGTGEWLDRQKDLWEYDPATDAWTQKADFGGTARTGAIGFAIGDKGYLGFGRDDAGYTKDFWQFDPVGNTWTPITSFPGDARNGAVVFVIGDFAYAGSGYNGTTRLKDFYKYDPAANTWTAMAEFPGASRRHAVAFAVDGKGYVGTGDSGSDLKDFWSYDPATDTWQQIVNFGGTARSVATSFSLNNKGYVSTGFDGSNRKDLWEFTAVNLEAGPVAPSNLTATGTSASEIALQWVDNSANETGFVVERSLNASGNFEVITTLSADATSFTDTGLNPLTTYYYRMKINTAVGASEYSTSVYATTLPLPPAAPSNLTASLGSGLEIQLTWTDNATNETGYVVERSVGDNANFSQIATPGAMTTLYSDKSIAYATTYYYRVKGTNDGGSSGYTNEVSVTTPAPPIAAPSGLTAEALSSTSIRLRWTDNSDNETLFRIFRSTDPSGSFVPFGTVDANVIEYVNTYLVVENTTYYYKILASSDQGDSEFTEVVSATTLKSMPAAPTNLTASYDDAFDDITLEWGDASFNEEQFVIEKSLGGSDFTELTTTTATTYTDENPGTTFQVFYRVAAKNNGGTSPYSNVAQIVITGIEPGAGITGVQTYPIPVVDKLTIEFSSAERGEVHVRFFDLTGREVKAATFEKDHEDLIGQVELTDVAGNAVLMMKISIGTKIVIRRVVLK